MNTPSHDELFVISDLHLGGKKGSQVFDQSARLAALVSRIREHRPKARVCLVINGDFVDFLAEPSPAYFDADGAVSKLSEVKRRFREVFRALAKFVQAPRRHLVLTLGNHDLELSLPWVRRWLLDTLSGGTLSGYGRITLAFDGAGYLCKVGEASVLCVHGNDVDDWNVTDYEELRKRGVEAHMRAFSSTWIPNAGTQMVIDFVNPMKNDGWPFIDLLKPEDPRALIPILIALEGKSVLKRLRSVAGPLARVGGRKIRSMTGFLGREGEGGSEQGTVVPTLAEARDPKPVIDEVYEAVEQGVDPLDLMDPSVADAPLGFTDALVGWIRGWPRSEQLRNALEWMAKDHTFDLGQSDETFAKLDEIVGDVDFLVAGHTHLRRALTRDRGGFYFNTGTWIRLLRISDKVLRPQMFEEAFEALQSRTLRELDSAEIAGEKFVLRQPTLARIRANSGATRGCLCDVKKDGRWVTVSGSEYSR